MGKARLALLLLALLAGHSCAHAKLVRKKTRGASKPARPSRTPKKYGERLPWEGRQETYDWEFREVHLHNLLLPSSDVCMRLHLSQSRVVLTDFSADNLCCLENLRRNLPSLYHHGCTCINNNIIIHRENQFLQASEGLQNGWYFLIVRYQCRPIFSQRLGTPGEIIMLGRWKRH